MASNPKAYVFQLFPDNHSNSYRNSDKTNLFLLFSRRLCFRRCWTWLTSLLLFSQDSLNSFSYHLHLPFFPRTGLFMSFYPKLLRCLYRNYFYCLTSSLGLLFGLRGKFFDHAICGLHISLITLHSGRNCSPGIFVSSWMSTSGWPVPSCVPPSSYYLFHASDHITGRFHNGNFSDRLFCIAEMTFLY